MPLLLIFLGVVLLVSAVRGTTSDLFALLKGDFAGKPNFLVWIGAILGIGAIGYIKEVRPISNALLGLLLVALFLSNKGFFANFTSAFQSTSQGVPPSQPAAQPSDQQSSGADPTQLAGFLDTFGGGKLEIQSPVWPSLPVPQPFSDLVLF